MKLPVFRKRMIYLLLGCKFAVIGTAAFLWMSSGYSMNQLKEIFFLIVPLFTANITIAIHYYIGKIGQAEEKQSIVPSPLRVIGIGGAVVYALYMILILIGFSNSSGDADSFMQMKEFIGGGEILFGFYIGYIISGIFNPGS